MNLDVISVQSIQDTSGDDAQANQALVKSRANFDNNTFRGSDLLDNKFGIQKDKLNKNGSEVRHETLEDQIQE